MRKFKFDSKNIRKKQKLQENLSKQQRKKESNKELWNKFILENPISNFLSLKSVKSLEVLESQKKIVLFISGDNVVNDKIDFYPCSNKMFLVPANGKNIWISNGLEWIKNNLT